MSRPLHSVFLDLHRQVDEFFDQLIFRPWAVRGGSVSGPLLDLHETADAYLIEIDLPGVAPEEVRLLVGERTFTVTGERKLPRPEGALFSRCERPGGTFHRSVDFPAAIDRAQARAECRLGTYRVHLPKKQPGAEPPSPGTPPPYTVLEVSIR